MIRQSLLKREPSTCAAARATRRTRRGLEPKRDKTPFPGKNPCSSQAIQLMKSTKDYIKDYDEDVELQKDVDEDFFNTLWEDETEVIDWAYKQLAKVNYRNWDYTDSSQGDYCRFIWDFGGGIILGANVHYTQGGKVAGNTYIKGVKDVAFKTNVKIVNNAPNLKPATTKRWSEL